MCSSRINPLFVINALQQGADGVLISGCHIGDCHYIYGNYYTRRRFAILRELLRYIGIEPERFRLSWVSASEGTRWAEVVTEVVNDVKKLGPIKKFQRVLAK